LEALLKIAKVFFQSNIIQLVPKLKNACFEALQKDITTRQEEQTIETSNTKQVGCFSGTSRIWLV